MLVLVFDKTGYLHEGMQQIFIENTEKLAY